METISLHFMYDLVKNGNVRNLKRITDDGLTTYADVALSDEDIKLILHFRTLYRFNFVWLQDGKFVFCLMNKRWLIINFSISNKIRLLIWDVPVSPVKWNMVNFWWVIVDLDDIKKFIAVGSDRVLVATKPLMFKNKTGDHVVEGIAIGAHHLSSDFIRFIINN